jgi:hypothetical protein
VKDGANGFNDDGEEPPIVLPGVVTGIAENGEENILPFSTCTFD